MQRLPQPDVSIVVPLYDEQDNVAPLCDAVREALAGFERSWELVLVDDGSGDETPQRLIEQARTDARIRVVALRRNAGQTAAMAAGFAAACGRVIVSMDGDLQNDPRDIPTLVARLDDGFDVVCGWRRDRQDHWLSRTLPSKVANWMIAKLTGIPIHDNGCSLKAYRAEVIRSIHLYSEMHRFLPAMSSLTGARIAEVVVRHHPRLHGESKYGLARTFKVLSDMIAIKAVTRFAQRPGVCFGLLAVPWLAGGLLLGWLWLSGLAGGGSTIVFSSLSVMFFYLFGHMVTLAILGELYLIYADRRYLGVLARVLATETPAGGRP